MSAGSTSGSFARNSVLWMQVSTLLSHANVSDTARDSVRRKLFGSRDLSAVSISAASAGLRVHKWELEIDWQRHDVLARTSATVNRRVGFTDEGRSTAVGVMIEDIERHFAENPTHRRGWSFESPLGFHEACRRAGLTAGKRLPDHPELRRYGSFDIPGLGEASLTVFGL